MSRTYWKADESVYEDVNRVVNAWHKDLAKYKVKFGILFAYSEKGNAITHGGYPAYATVRILSLRDRVSKGYEIEITIDAEAWKDFRKEHKDALLDHELSHVELKRHKPKKNTKKRLPDEDDDDDVTRFQAEMDELTETPSVVEPKPENDEEELGEVMLDDHDRPMLKTRKGDWNGGDGFKDVIRRHGDFAIERMNADQVRAIIDSVAPEPHVYNPVGRIPGCDSSPASMPTGEPLDFKSRLDAKVDELRKISEGPLSVTPPHDGEPIELSRASNQSIHDPIDDSPNSLDLAHSMMSGKID